MNIENHNRQIRERYNKNPEVRKAKAEYHKRYMSDPVNRAKKEAYRKEYESRPEVREKIRKRKTNWARGYRKNPEVMKRMVERNRIKANKLKDIIFDHYGKFCNCCGETIPQFLSIDHVNNDGNKHRKKMGVSGGITLYKDIIASGFSNDYQILCMSCNFGKKVNGGVCPHKDILSSFTKIKK